MQRLCQDKETGTSNLGGGRIMSMAFGILGKVIKINILFVYYLHIYFGFQGRVSLYSLAVLELTLQTRLVSSSQRSTCLCFLNTGIKVVCHHCPANNIYTLVYEHEQLQCTLTNHLKSILVKIENKKQTLFNGPSDSLSFLL